MNSWFSLQLALVALHCCNSAFAGEPYGSSCQKIGDAKVSDSSYSSEVIEVARSMPKGGGYDPSDATIESLSKTIQVKNGRIELNSNKAQASFCSGATYSVFLKVVSQQQRGGKLELSPEAADALKVLSKSQQPDGSGVWGRWNANGEGVAVLFKELNLGRNFSTISEAQPGDFLQLHWNEIIGGEKDSGHSVIFDSVRDCKSSNDAASVRHVCFWSSNTTNDVDTPGDKKGPKGWGLKCVPEARIYRTTFSRLESLTNLNDAPTAIGKNSSQYVQKDLAKLTNQKITTAEADRMIYNSQNTTPKSTDAHR